MGDNRAEQDRDDRRRRVESLTRITLRPIGSPLPLGFAALGAASLVFSGVQLGWVGVADDHQAAIAVMAFAVPLQLLASVFGFLARDSVGGTGMGLVAGSWLVIGLLTLEGPAGSRSPVLGLLLLAAAAGLIVPTVAASLGKVVAAVIMFAAAGRFALSGIYELRGGVGWERVSGWWGVAACAVSLYGALAFELEDTRRRTVLPVLRHGVGRAAVTGGVHAELERADLEAGVREQL